METLILGGGLAGLGAGLTAPGPVTILEALDRPGGLTLTDEERGYHFDKTGHIIHLRRPVEKRLIRDVLRGKLTRRKRRAAVYLKGRLIPYPFQTHFPLLGEPWASRWIRDFKLAKTKHPRGGPQGNFEVWCRGQFGNGIAEAFMLPYNEKLFRIPPRLMDPSWRGVFIPRPSLSEVLRAKREGELSGQGYNAVFSYPSRGGIEALPRGLARILARREDAELRCSTRVLNLDLEARTAGLSGGRRIRWKSLVSTLPLPETLKLCGKLPDAVRRAASKLRWVGVLNFNLGFKGLPWPGLHWVYFSEPQFPFYRVGFPSRFSDGAAPRGTTSCYVEVSYKPEEGPNRAAVEKAVLGSLRSLGLIPNPDRLDVLRCQDIPYAYVVFDAHREGALRVIRGWLRSRGVIAAGRYGEWTYGSMEDALASGRQAGIELQTTGPDSK